MANRNHSQLTLFATCYRSKDHPPQEQFWTKSTPVWLWFVKFVSHFLMVSGGPSILPSLRKDMNKHHSRKNCGVLNQFPALHQRENLPPLLVFVWASHHPGLMSAANQLVLLTSHDLVFLILFHPVDLFQLHSTDLSPTWSLILMIT